MGSGNILIPLERLEELELSVKDVPIPLLKDNWVADNGAYKQTIEIERLTAENEPIIMLSSVSNEATDEELNAYLCLEDKTIVEDGRITFFASEKPPISFTVIAKGVVAGEGQEVSAVTALVAKVNELETENTAQAEQITKLNSDITQLRSKLTGTQKTFSATPEANSFVSPYTHIASVTFDESYGTPIFMQAISSAGAPLPIMYNASQKRFIALSMSTYNITIYARFI